MVTSEIEKLRAELRYTHEKVSSSQKLDMNLERGRIRDDLQAGLHSLPGLRLVTLPRGPPTGTFSGVFIVALFIKTSGLVCDLTW
jgi:hypothetical protein